MDGAPLVSKEHQEQMSRIQKVAVSMWLKAVVGVL